MAHTSLTVKTARNLSEYDLTLIGRFNTRVLAQELGMFTSRESQMAFMQMTNEAQAKALYRVLQSFHSGEKDDEIRSRGKELAKVERDAGQIITTQSTQIELHVAYDLKLRELNTLLQKAIRMAKAADSDYIEVNTKAQKKIEELTAKLEEAEARYQAHRVRSSELLSVKKELAQANAKLKLAKEKKKPARLGKSTKAELNVFTA